MILLKFNWDIDLGFIVGFLGFVISMMAMLRTRKLEKQQYKLNQYEIEEKEKEREEAKHANLKISKVTNISDIETKLMIDNRGKNDANYVELKIVNKSLEQAPKQMWIEDEIPKRIGSGDRFYFVVYSWTGDNILEIKVTWQDEAGIWNRVERVQIH